MKKYFLTAMLVFKDESRYLKEWLEYHILIGVQHFYVYDNNSTDKPLEILKWFIDNGFVTYKTLSSVFTRNSSAKPHRMDVISKHGHDSEWMLFLDIDEFLRLRGDERDTHEVLYRYSLYSSISLRRINFGTNFLEKYEDRPTIERFFRREKRTSHIKPLVRPEHVAGVIDAHRFSIKKIAGIKHPFTISMFYDNVDHLTRRRPHVDPGRDPLIINHYVSKSQEEFFKFKNKEQNNPSPLSKRCFSMQRFRTEWCQKANAVVDKEMWFFVEFLEKNVVQNNFLKIKKYYHRPTNFCKNSGDLLPNWNKSPELKKFLQIL